jgi:hypothetical protein
MVSKATPILDQRQGPPSGPPSFRLLDASGEGTPSWAWRVPYVVPIPSALYRTANTLSRSRTIWHYEALFWLLQAHGSCDRRRPVVALYPYSHHAERGVGQLYDPRAPRWDVLFGLPRSTAHKYRRAALHDLEALDLIEHHGDTVRLNVPANRPLVRFNPVTALELGALHPRGHISTPVLAARGFRALIHWRQAHGLPGTPRTPAEVEEAFAGWFIA